MAKRTLTTAQINKLLKFKPGWIKDPVPTFRQHLDPGSFKQVARAKGNFRKEIERIVKNRQG